MEEIFVATLAALVAAAGCFIAVTSRDAAKPANQQARDKEPDAAE